MSASEARGLRDLETETARLKKLLAEPVLENASVKEALRKKGGNRSGPLQAGA